MCTALRRRDCLENLELWCEIKDCKVLLERGGRSRQQSKRMWRSHPSRNISKIHVQGFPGAPMAKTPHSQCSASGFDPRSVN